MIQDIAPKKLDNQYKVASPKDTDLVVAFLEKDILIQETEQGELILPTIGQLRRQGYQGEFRYYFSVDQVGYFAPVGEVQAFDEFEYKPSRSFRNLISKDVCFEIMTAWHLHLWYKSNRFCGACGHETVHSEKERMLRCPECGNMIFPKIAPAVIVAVTNGDYILLTKYADRDYKKYALLAGFTEIGETPEETVAREVMEEVGLKVKNIRYYKSQPWGIDSNLLLGFFCDLDGSDEITMDEEELSVALWAHRDNMPAKDDGISLTREMMRVFEMGGE